MLNERGTLDGLSEQASPPGVTKAERLTVVVIPPDPDTVIVEVPVRLDPVVTLPGFAVSPKVRGPGSQFITMIVLCEICPFAPDTVTL